MSRLKILMLTRLFPSREFPSFGTFCMERAKALLRESGLSITELALELGFSSPAHFSSRFRQLTGLTPSDWRAAASAWPD